jgi:type III pantothenate kinase
MKAYLDQGNTQLKLWIPCLDHKIAVANDADWRAVLAKVISESSLEQFVVASVAGDQKLNLLLSFLKQYGEVESITTDQDCGWTVRPCYQDVARLGVDRLLAMEAAYRLEGRAVIVIDCGSAVTVDVVSDEGLHLGGYIVPGYRLQQRSLLLDTSLEFKAIETSLALGQSTDQCINFGIARMVYSLCQSVIEQFNRPAVFLTGGDLDGVLGLFSELGSVKPDLVFKGMSYLK